MIEDSLSILSEFLPLLTPGNPLLQNHVGWGIFRTLRLDDRLPSPWYPTHSFLPLNNKVGILIGQCLCSMTLTMYLPTVRYSHSRSIAELIGVFHEFFIFMLFFIIFHVMSYC